MIRLSFSFNIKITHSVDESTGGGEVAGNRVLVTDIGVAKVVDESVSEPVKAVVPGSRDGSIGVVDVEILLEVGVARVSWATILTVAVRTETLSLLANTGTVDTDHSGLAGQIHELEVGDNSLEASVLASEELGAEGVGPVARVNEGGLLLHAVLLDELVKALGVSRLGSRHLKLRGLDGILGVVESLNNLSLAALGCGLELVFSLLEFALKLGAGRFHRFFVLGVSLEVNREVFLGSDIVEVHEVAKGTHVHRG